MFIYHTTWKASGLLLLLATFSQLWATLDRICGLCVSGFRFVAKTGGGHRVLSGGQQHLHQRDIRGETGPFS